MARVIQCPNLSCRRTSQLGEDPLGRIFRCPRCLTKLPTAEVNAADSGWTNVLGPLPRAAQETLRVGFRPLGRQLTGLSGIP